MKVSTCEVAGPAEGVLELVHLGDGVPAQELSVWKDEMLVKGLDFSLRMSH